MGKPAEFTTLIVHIWAKIKKGIFKQVETNELKATEGEIDDLVITDAIKIQERAGDPPLTADRGKIYTKEIAGRTELFYIDDTGVVTQITALGGPVVNFWNRVGGELFPVNPDLVRPLNDGTIDHGTPTRRWRDGYYSRYLYTPTLQRLDNGALLLTTTNGDVVLLPTLGQIDASSKRIKNVAAPTIAGDAVPYPVAPGYISPQGALSGLDADLLDGQHLAYALARANHTGTQLKATISDFAHDILSASHGDALAAAVAQGAIIVGDATPKWSRLIANATATNKFLRSVSGGVPSWEQVAWGDLSGVPASFTPSAHKDTHKTGQSDAFLNTDILDAAIRYIRESGGPTTLAVGAIADGQYGKRSGATFIGDDPIKTETSEYLPIPEGRCAGGSTRACQTTLEGAAYFLRRKVQFNRAIIRCNNVGVNTGLNIGIYQASGGGGGVASLVATMFANVNAAGQWTLTPTEGTVTLSEGLIYVLWGKISPPLGGNAVMDTYLTQAAVLLNSVVDANTHPTHFTTVIDADVLPATFNPLESGDANATANDVAIIIRLRKV